MVKEAPKGVEDGTFKPYNSLQRRLVEGILNREDSQ